MVADRVLTPARRARRCSGRAHGLALMRPSALILVVLLAAPTAPNAQSGPPGDGNAPVEWIRPEEVPARADTLLRRLDATRSPAAAAAAVERIERLLPQLGRDLDESIERATAALARSASPAELEDLHAEITGIAAPLGDWKDELEGEAKRVAQVMDEIAHGQRIWSQTRRRPETVAAGEVVLRRVESSIEALNAAAAKLHAWRERVLAISDRGIDRVAAVDDILEKLRATAVVERSNLFVPDKAPLWARGFGAAIRGELPRVPDEILAYARSTREYVARDPRPFVVQALLVGLLMFALGRFSTRARARLAGETVASRAARLLECPYAVGLLLGLLVSPVFHPLAPRRLMQLLAMIALFPAARIVTRVSERANLTAFSGLLVVLLLDRIGLAIVSLPTLARATFLLTLAVGLGLGFWCSRRVQPEGAMRWLRHTAHLAMLAIALALLAEIGGWTYLSTLLGRGILAGVLAGLYIYAAGIAVAALVAYALASRTFHRSYLLGRNTAILQRRAERGLHWLGVGLWLYFVVTALGLRSAAATALEALLNAGVSVGALSLSVGDVLAFSLTLLAAPLVARLVTGVLEEDVYPRTSLPRGVPYALSTMVRYGIYSLGFLFALAAAGVQLGQVGILIGGLGVGIGLGLQDLVKNFAAGLTLLFERRVHVGDAIQTSSQDAFGRVLAIGMRATVVRNWNGAEVVVPNADLVSTAVTNWTLSDRLCRIEVPVGVAYGTDPERVLALLLDAVRSIDQLLAEPPPQALFKGFGESSLDFVVRAWTEGYERTLLLSSELAVAVHRSICEAGITIPFPQRDLHLASVSPEASAALSGVDSSAQSAKGLQGGERDG
jgi:potassium-dependent mechanosensitive channel